MPVEMMLPNFWRLIFGIESKIIDVQVTDFPQENSIPIQV